MTKTLAGFRLSPQQKYLWKLQENNLNYLAKCTIKIQGKVKVNILKFALEKILNRHDSFRTIFQRRPGIKMPIQVILDNANISWSHINLSNFKSEKQTEQIEEILQQQNSLIARLDQQPIFPTAFITLSETEHLLLVSLPALIADSFTLNNLVKEISESYDFCLKELDFDEERVQYIQFSEWQNELLEEEEAETEIAYWQNQQFQWVNLPFEKSQFEEEKFTPQQYSLNLDQNVIAKLEANILPDITIDNFLLACWQTLLWQLTKQSDITVKTVFSGRQYEDLEEIMGLLAKSLPISCQLEENLKFTQLLAEINDRLTEAAERQEYFLNPETEVPAIGFEFIDISKIYYGGDLSFTLENQSVIFDNLKFKLNCIKTQESLMAEFQYNSELINIDVIKSFAKQFETLVASAVENIDATISQLNICSESESKSLLDELNKTDKNYPQDKLIHQIFESQTEQTPNNIAVIFEDKKLTYAELNSQANQLAHYLQKIGVEAETIVGIYMERSLEVIIAILAILKAGGAYLPIDTKLPENNLAFRLEDAGVNILLSQSEIAPKNLERDIKIIDIFQKLATENTEYLTSTRAKNLITTITQQPQTNPTNNITAENLAYILYTSGSTGKPKGVAIEHRQILNYLNGIQEKLEISSTATSAIVSTFAADLGNTVVFPTLCSGGCLHIISQECASDATALTDYFQRHPIDYLKIVPSHLSALLTSNPSLYLLPRQCLILGGEAATWDLIAKIQQHSPQCRILNHYGPTETTVGVLTYAVNNRNNYNTKTVPIGCPLSNTQVYVLDEKLQPVPVGVSGELYIGGAGLARGYFNRPELTGEKFIPLPSPLTTEKLEKVTPFQRGVRGNFFLYKTGDLVRYLPDGNIEFLGRIDNQIKIRGFRIELGEIETAIASHPEIQTAVVIARENNSNNKRLIAYFVPIKKQFSPNNLRQFLQEKLADYAIPSNFVKLEFLPLTPNGKIDRKALPEPDSFRPELENNFVAPRNQTESLLANIWSELLGVEKIGIYDDFFELGGHSLLATQLISKIRETFQIKIPLKTLFDFHTIIKLAATIDKILQTGIFEQDKTDFNAEAILDNTIITQTTISKNIVNPQNILLTGVTGFVGAYLLDELLRQTSANIYCLIREVNADSAKQKLQNKLESYLLWDEKFSSRIIPVVGDLSSKFFGLSKEQFNQLGSQIDVIYHSGAWVNHIYPYSVLKSTNVLGTQEILRLASEIHVKPVHFISTIGVLPSSSNSESRTILESDYLTEIPNIKSGYQQSKWVAEKLVMAARDRGIPSCIYRLPMITADINTGVSNINDRICRQIKGCIQLGMVPILEKKLLDNWVPVNNISQAIVHLSQQENSLGKAFHLMNPTPTSFNNLFDWICFLDSSVKKVSLNDWVSELSSHPENVLYPYLFKFEFQIEKSTEKQSYIPSRIIDTQNTKDGLASSNISFSSIDDKYLETMVSYLIKSGFLNLYS